MNTEKTDQLYQNALSYLKDKNKSKESFIEVLKTIEFFKRDQDNLKEIESICKESYYHYQSNESFLFHQNSYHEHLYVLFFGEAVDLVQKKDFEINQEISLAQKIGNLEQSIRLEHLHQRDANQLKRDLNETISQLNNLSFRNEKLDKSIFDNCGFAFKNQYFIILNGILINKYKANKIYSQSSVLGLPSKNDNCSTKKASSIFTITECKLCCIKLSTLKKIFESKFTTVRFLLSNSFNLFQSEDRLDLFYSIPNYFKKIQTEPDQIMIEQYSKDAGDIYLIRNGSFEYRFEDNTIKTTLLTLTSGMLIGLETNFILEKKYDQGVLFRRYSVVCVEKGEVYQLQSNLLTLLQQNPDAKSEIFRQRKEFSQILDQKFTSYVNDIKAQVQREQTRDYIKKKTEFMLSQQKVHQFLQTTKIQKFKNERMSPLSVVSKQQIMERYKLNSQMANQQKVMQRQLQAKQSSSHFLEQRRSKSNQSSPKNQLNQITTNSPQKRKRICSFSTNSVEKPVILSVKVVRSPIQKYSSILI